VSKHGKPRKGKLLTRMGIPKNTHMKACWEVDEERRFLWENPKDYIFKILLLILKSVGAKL
jgi:hypothetical protein